MRALNGVVEVDLSDFDADDIVKEAIEIIERHLKEGGPPAKDRSFFAHEYYKKIEEHTQTLTKLLRAQPFPETDELPPPSTAARIRTMEELRKHLEKTKGSA